MSIVLTASNFGPIAQGTVNLTPLTVFTGANNTGKSFFATFVYAATGRSPASLITYASSFEQGDAGYQTLLRGTRIDGEARRLIQRYVPGGSQRRSKVSRRLVDLTEDTIKRVLRAYVALVGHELERCFGAPLDVAGRGGLPGEALRLEIAERQLGWRVALEVVGERSKPFYDVVAIPDIEELLISVAKRLANEDTRRVEMAMARDFAVYYQYGVAGGSRHRATIGDALLIGCVRECFASLPEFRYYLPAARSGILQSHKALASAVIARATYAGLEDMGVPRLPGLVADFLLRLINMQQERETPFAEVASYIEGSVLEGRIEFDPSTAVGSTGRGYPSISYRSRDRRHPIERTSSMVSELAPVVLYLRYLLDPGELLIIEEPESHLHPGSQVRFARGISRVVHGGASVLLTTHSDYFLGQVNNLVRASSLSAAAREKAGIGAIECLNPEIVSAYLFAQGSDGTTIREVEVTSADGISEAGLVDVAEELYDQTVALQRAIT